MQQNVMNGCIERSHLVQLVRKWAGINTDGILDKATLIFSVPHIEGLIGYRMLLDHAIVYGDPVCSPEHKVALAKAFAEYCLNKKLQIIYIIVSETFADLATQHLSVSLMEFGRKFILDPFKYAENKSSLLRKKIRQSSRHGVEIHEYLGDHPDIEKEIEQVAITWMQGRKGIQIHLGNPTLFADRLGKRWFYATQGGNIIGLAILNQLSERGGWLLNNVMVLKGSPPGVSEHLVTSALQAVEKDNCRLVLIGPVPAKTLGRMEGFGKVTTSFSKWAFRAIKRVCRLDGHEIFWEKFQPEPRSSYLLFPKNGLRLRGIMALLRTLNISLR